MKKLFAIVALGALVLNAGEAFASCGLDHSTEQQKPATSEPVASTENAISAEESEAVAQEKATESQESAEAKSEEIASTEAE